MAPEIRSSCGSSFFLRVLKNTRAINGSDLNRTVTTVYLRRQTSSIGVKPPYCMAVIHRTPSYYTSMILLSAHPFYVCFLQSGWCIKDTLRNSICQRLIISGKITIYICGSHSSRQAVAPLRCLLGHLLNKLSVCLRNKSFCCFFFNTFHSDFLSLQTTPVTPSPLPLSLCLCVLLTAPICHSPSISFSPLRLDSSI